MSNNVEIAPVEQFLVVQAMYKKLAEQVNTKDPDNMRGHIDAAYKSEYDRTGGKSFSMKLGGEKVATYSISESKGTPAKTTRRLVVRDPHKLEKFIEDNMVQCVQAEEMPYAEMYAQAMAQNFAEYVLENFGEVCDGCEVVKHTTPGKPGGVYSGNSIRGLDEDAVLAKAVDMGLLSTRIAGLLGGGDDGE